MNKYIVRVQVELYYEFEDSEFPSFSTPDGVTHLVAAAFDDYGPVSSLSDFETRLDRTPIEIANVKFSEG